MLYFAHVVVVEGQTFECKVATAVEAKYKAAADALQSMKNQGEQGVKFRTLKPGSYDIAILFL